MKLDLHMPENPWHLVALGALAGMWAATHARRRSTEPPGVVMGVLGALVLRAVRDVAIHEMGKIATTIVTPRDVSTASSPYAS